MRKSTRLLSIITVAALVFTLFCTTVFAAGAEVSLSKDKFKKAQAGDITATYSGVSGPSPWMGLYRRDTVPAPGTGPALAWKDIAAGSGTFDLKGLQDAAEWEAAGTGLYKLCLFSAYDPVNGVYPLIAQVNFEIVDSTPAITLNKTSFTKAEVAQIVATYENITGSRPWMGIYDRNDTPGSGDVKSLAWKDIPAGDGTFDFSELQDADDWNSAAKGEFKLCIFANYDKVNGIYPILAQVNFTLAEESTGGNDTNPGQEETTPVTGDYSVMAALVLALAAAAGACALAIKKQKA